MPVITTTDIVERFKIVKILFSIVDSLTPIDNIKVTTKITANAKKSGYSDNEKNSKYSPIGIASLNAFFIALLAKLVSMYSLKALPKLAVPESKNMQSNNEFF